VLSEGELQELQDELEDECELLLLLDEDFEDTLE